MPAASTAFSSLEVKPRTNEGINGSLTPARRRRQYQRRQQQPLPSRKNTNDIGQHSTATLVRGHAAAYSNATDQFMLWGREGGRDGDAFGAAADRLAGGEGISLQETAARIDELERSEFDLKMRLFYTEERLEEAVGGEDALQLHREIAHVKRVSTPWYLWEWASAVVTLDIDRRTPLVFGGLGFFQYSAREPRRKHRREQVPCD